MNQWMISGILYSYVQIESKYVYYRFLKKLLILLDCMNLFK